MRIIDWSSDVCSSDMSAGRCGRPLPAARFPIRCSFPLDPHCLSGAAIDKAPMAGCPAIESPFIVRSWPLNAPPVWIGRPVAASDVWPDVAEGAGPAGLEHAHWRGLSFVRTPVASSRSEEHTSELQSLMRISYAVFCLKKNK